MALCQREQAARQSAQRARQASQPEKSAEVKARLVRQRDAPEQGAESQCQGYSDRHQTRSTVCGSKPTMSRYAKVIAAIVTGMETKSPTMQHSTPRISTRAINKRNMVNPK